MNGSIARLGLFLSLFLYFNLAAAARGASDLLSVGWGASFLPVELEDFAGFAETSQHGLTIKADGTVVGWGINVEGVLDVPVGLSNGRMALSSHWETTVLAKRTCHPA